MKQEQLYRKANGGDWNKPKGAGTPVTKRMIWVVPVDPCEHGSYDGHPDGPGEWCNGAALEVSDEAR